jgi:hypothetical protein
MFVEAITTKLHKSSLFSLTTTSFSPTSINSPPFPAVSSPSRSIPQKGPCSQYPSGHTCNDTCLETLTSAAAMVVSSAFVSYAGATSTISAETMWSPSKPRKMVRNSRVDQPPVSGVPVAGANAGSIESICKNEVQAPHPSQHIRHRNPAKRYGHRWRDKPACRQPFCGSSR